MAVDGETEFPSMGSFVLSLRLGGTEPPSGTIGAFGGAAAQPFHGWIGLMSAINTLRGWESVERDARLLPEPPARNPCVENRRDSGGDFDP